MAGLREWIRSRSKSRSRGSREIKAEQQAAEAPEEKPPPLPLMRPDASYGRPQESRQTPSEDAYPGLAQAPQDPLTTLGRYDSVRAGDEPQRGTYPLHGNAGSRPPSQYRAEDKSPSRANRTFSLGSRSSKRISSGPASIPGRQSLPPGTAVTTDSPTAAPMSSRRSASSSSRQPVSSMITGMYGNPGPSSQAQASASGMSSRDAAPAVPSIPGQYASSNTSNTQSLPSRDRVVSTSSRGSTNSRTPIAEEFASSSWYQRNEAPTAPERSEAKDNNIGIANSSPYPHTLKHQPDVNNLGGQASAQRSMPTEADTRGRSPRRSLDKPLPVPKELQEAPWNGNPSQIPISAPLNFSGGSQPQPTNGGRAMDRDVDSLADDVQPLSISKRPKPSTQPIVDGPFDTSRLTYGSAPMQDYRPPQKSRSMQNSRPLQNDRPLQESRPVQESTPTQNARSMQQSQPLQQSHQIPGAFDASDGLLYDSGETPYFDSDVQPELNPFSQAEVRSGQANISNRSLAVKNSAVQPSLKGVVDLTNTEDTSVHKRTAPAVVHETILTDVHHIREERVTRDIHDHEVYHRVLPVVDVQVLPARHFVPTSWVPEDSPHHPKNITPSSYGLGSLSKSGSSGDEQVTNGELSNAKANAASGFSEVPASFLPERTQGRYTNKNWAVVETASKIPSHITNAEAMAHAPWRHFTAKRFSGDEGDTKEWIESGVQRSERTWVHPPTHDMALKKQGLTQPLDMTADCYECVNERGAATQRV